MNKLISSIAWSILVLGCDSSTEVPTHDSETENPPADAFSIGISLASDHNPEAPGTVGIVTWSHRNIEPDIAEIRYGPDTHYGMIAPVDLNEPDYRTLLLGMKPNRKYHFRVVATKGGKRYQSRDYTIETGPATNLVNVVSTIHNEESHRPGFIISTQLHSDLAVLADPSQDDENGIDWKDIMNTGSMVFILDGDGDVVWWYKSRLGLTPRARMSYDGKSMWLIPDKTEFTGGKIELVSMDTLKSTIYEKVKGATHDATVVNNKILAYIDYGEDDCGSVFELDRDGNEVEIFESSEYISNPPSYDPKACHLNAIRFNEAEQVYTVSDRAHDIFVINRRGEVQWRLSEIVSNETYGAEQHGHQLLSETIVLFANVGGDDETAGAIEYALDDGTEVFRYSPGIRSKWYGDVQRLPEGNTLVTFSIAGAMHEVDPQGNPIMEIEGEVFGYAEWRSSLYGPPSDIRTAIDGRE